MHEGILDTIKTHSCIQTKRHRRPTPASSAFNSAFLLETSLTCLAAAVASLLVAFSRLSTSFSCRQTTCTIKHVVYLLTHTQHALKKSSYRNAQQFALCQHTWAASSVRLALISSCNVSSRLRSFATASCAAKSSLTCLA